MVPPILKWLGKESLRLLQLLGLICEREAPAGGPGLASARCQGPARPRRGSFWLYCDPRGGNICTGPGWQSWKRPLCWLTRCGPLTGLSINLALKSGKGADARGLTWISPPGRKRGRQRNQAGTDVSLSSFFWVPHRGRPTPLWMRPCVRGKEVFKTRGSPPPFKRPRRFSSPPLLCGATVLLLWRWRRGKMACICPS